MQQSRVQQAQPAARARLRLGDVRRIFRLIAEIRRRGDDPAQWRPFMARQLLKLFDAEVVISSEVYLSATSDPAVWDVVDVGWGADGTGHDWRIENRSRETNPQVYHLIVRDTAASPRPEASDRDADADDHRAP